MSRRFHVSGECNPERHYTLPSSRRVPGVRERIDARDCFVLRGPRQMGKSTALVTLASELTREGRYIAVLVSAPFSHNVWTAEESLLGALRRACEARLPRELQPPPSPPAAPGERIAATLLAWSRVAPRPLVLFLDEIDAMGSGALMSALRQIREGYCGRPTGFPWSIGLIGRRDARAYEVESGGSDRLVSPGLSEVTLGELTPGEIDELYRQHTEETGQRFLPEAVDVAWKLSLGHPWLVNALAQRLVEEVVPDPKQAITAEDVVRARGILIRNSSTHLGSSIDKLQEERARRILSPMISGDELPPSSEEDIQLVVDLGLLRRDREGRLVAANPIYREIILRDISMNVQVVLPPIALPRLTPDGQTDVAGLLEAFLEARRAYREALRGAPMYSEIAAHLMLVAFLKRVEEVGGMLTCKYGLRRGRMDLCLRWGTERAAMEVKVWREGGADPRAQGLAQIDGYLAGLGLDAGWLIIFDQRAGLPPIEERTRAEAARTPSGRGVVIVYA